jgi:two-component system chemotaxis sensor kinase CheA
MDASIQQQLIADLLVESFEGLDRYDHELLQIESGTAGADSLNVIFRVIHTIKGTAGCLGLSHIQRVAHTGENLLDLLRSGGISASPEMISALLKLSDALRSMLRSLEVSGSEGDADHSPLISLLDRLQEPLGAVEPLVPAPVTAPASSPVQPQAAEPAPATSASAPDAGFGFFDDEPASVPGPETLFPAPVPAPKSFPEPAAPSASPGAGAGAPAASVASGAPPSENAGRSNAEDSAIRVDVAHLDRLMNLVGELVLARNQILQKAGVVQDPTLLSTAQRLNVITTELQEGVMKTRMQPIGNVWTRFPRIVRDVSAELGKKVRLYMEGRETELDRTIIEAIKDPLIHIVRNAIDHGIESPERRAASGKPEEGALVLRAYHEGGQVIIEIADDGAGINAEKVRARALRDGRITAEQAARMPDREAFHLVFLPGLSTAEKITNVSGRGVGMDVVKTNIERIGGSIELLSELGSGTTLRIKIPLTLAIIPALIVTSGGERFAIPQVSLVELVRIDTAGEGRGIESLYGAPVYRLRERLLPLAMLDRELGIVPAEAATPGSEAGSNLIVLQADGRQFGLVVDEINDTQEIVVKPLSKIFRSLTCYAGATIMGDGRVALILDVLGLAQRASVLSDATTQAAAIDPARAASVLANREKLLLIEAGGGSRLAIPLSSVDRLEEFERSRFEWSGGRQVIQYRGGILPLVPLNRLVPNLPEPAESTDHAQVVVHSSGGRSVGILVGQVSDIVEEEGSERAAGDGSGLLGSTVIQGRVVDLFDPTGLHLSSL